MGSYEIRSERRDEQQVAVARATLGTADIGTWIGEAFGKVAQAAADQGVELVGMPFGRFLPVGGDRMEATAGMPVATTIEPTDDVEADVLPGGEVAVTLHVGSYEDVPAAYDAVHAWVAEHGTPAGAPWEVYLNDPGEHPDPATWETEVVQPYRPNA